MLDILLYFIFTFAWLFLGFIGLVWLVVQTDGEVCCTWGDLFDWGWFFIGVMILIGPIGFCLALIEFVSGWAISSNNKNRIKKPWHDKPILFWLCKEKDEV